MLINCTVGTLDISLNTRYYDISHPSGAIRSFSVTAEPSECNGIISWTAVSNDCYKEEIHVRLSVDADNKNLIFKDYASAESFLVNEYIRIELSSIEYQLMSAIDVLCGKADSEMADTFKTFVDSIELHLLGLILKLDSYDDGMLEQIKDVSVGIKELSQRISSLKSSHRTEVYSIVLSLICSLQNYRDVIASMKEDLCK